MVKKLSTFQWVMLIICIFLLFFNRLIPPFGGLNEAGVQVLCMVIGTLLMMLFIDLIMPALFLILALPLSGLYSLGETLGMTMGHSVVNFMIFNGLMLYVLQETGVLRRIAINMITMPLTQKNPKAFVAGLWLVIFIIGSFIDITANVILFSLLIIEILDQIGVKKGDKLGEVLLFGNMIFSCVSYGATPIGHSVPLLAISTFSEYQEVSMLKYTVVGFVFGLICWALFCAVELYVLKVDLSPLADYDSRQLKASLGTMSKGEKIAIWVFVAVVVLWLSPDFLKGLPTVHGLISSVGIVGAPLLAVIVMCIIRVDNKPLLNFNDAMLSGGVAWAPIFLMAASMALGSIINNPDAGIPAFLAATLGGSFGSMAPFTFVLIMAIICIVITNFTSCTVALTIAYTVALAFIASVTGVSAGGLAIALGIGACLAFMTPPAGTSAAVTIGYGYVTSGQMFKKGAVYAVIMGILSIVIGYYLGMAIL